VTCLMLYSKHVQCITFPLTQLQMFVTISSSFTTCILPYTHTAAFVQVG